MVDKKVLYEILNSRENRALMQKKIIEMYKHSLISFTLNIPGPNKDSIEYRRIHDEGMRAITNTLEEKGYKIEYIERIYKSTGAEGYISIDIEPIELKIITVEIEDTHSLGRLFDIDVFDRDHNQISRRDIGYHPRKCLICDKDARVCSRSGLHSLDELIEKINYIYNSFLNNSEILAKKDL